MKKVRVFIERGRDGGYGAYMPDDNGLSYGVSGVGDTVAEVVDDFNAAYEEMKEYYAEEGKPFEEVEFAFSYDVPSFLQYYKGLLTLAGLSHITGVAQGQLSHYVTGRRHPSVKTVEKIQKALEWVKSLTEEPEVGKIYEGTVVTIKDFGAFVNIMPGVDGMLHISQIVEGRRLKSGDEVLKVERDADCTTLSIH